MINKSQFVSKKPSQRQRAEDLLAKIRLGAIKPKDVQLLIKGPEQFNGSVEIEIDGKQYTATPVE